MWPQTLTPPVVFHASLSQVSWPGSPGPTLKTGMVFAVEPMVNAGGAGTVQLDDGWSVVTADGRLSAHFEHTVLTTDKGPEILTVPGLVPAK